jgi:hypothetical protein
MSLNIGAARLARRLAMVEGQARQDGALPPDTLRAELGALLDATIQALRDRYPGYEAAAAA